MTGRLHVQWGDQSHLISMGSSTFLGPSGRSDVHESAEPGSCAWLTIHRSGARYLLKPLRPVVLEGDGGRSQRVVVVSPGEVAEITAIWGEQRHHVSCAIEGSGAPPFRAVSESTPRASGNDNWSTPLTTTARTVREFEAALLSKPLPIPDDLEGDLASATSLAATSWLGTTSAYASSAPHAPSPAPASPSAQVSTMDPAVTTPDVSPESPVVAADEPTGVAAPAASAPPVELKEEKRKVAAEAEASTAAPELDVHVRDLHICDSAGRSVVEGLSFDIAPRSVVALVGPAGSGTSLVAAALAGEQELRSGTMHLASRPLRHGFPQGTCGFVREDSQSQTKLLVIDVLTRAAMTVTRSPREAKRSAQAIIDRLDLGDMTKQRVNRLPRDMRLTVAFAEEALRRPQVIVVDDVVDALSPQQRENFLSVAMQVAGEGTSVVLTAQGHHHFPEGVSVVPVDSAEPSTTPTTDLPAPDSQGALWTYTPRRKALRRRVAQDAALVSWNRLTSRLQCSWYTVALVALGPLLTALFAAALSVDGLASDGPTPYVRIPSVVMALIAGVAVQATLVGAHPAFTKWDAIKRDVQWGYSVRSTITARMVWAMSYSVITAVLTTGLFVILRPGPEGIGHFSGLFTLGVSLAFMSVCQTLLTMALRIAIPCGGSFVVGIATLFTVVLCGLPIALATAPGAGGYIVRAVAALCPGRWAVVALAAPLHLGQVVPAPDPAWGHSAGEMSAAWVVLAVLSGLFAIFVCVAATIRCSRAHRRD